MQTANRGLVARVHTMFALLALLPGSALASTKATLPTISYPASSYTLTKYTKLTPITPVLGGGVTSLTISPAIDTTPGLKFDASTGALTGIPSAVAGALTYTVKAKNSAGTASATLSIAVIPQMVPVAPPPSSAQGCEYVLNVADFMSTNSAVASQMVYVGNTPILPSADGYYHVPLTNSSNQAYIDNNDLSALPYGVWEVKRSAGSFTAGNWGHEDNDPINKTGYVSYNTAATLNCNIVAVSNVKGANGFEDEGDGIAITGFAGDDQYWVAGNSITAESTTTTAADLYVVTYAVPKLAPPTISYSGGPYSYTIGAQVALGAILGGGPVQSCTASQLPASLAIASSTCAISGTVTSLSLAAVYTVIASNGAGSNSATISIAVVDVPPSALAYAAPASFEINQPIAPLSPQSAGGAIVSYAVSPPLPAGLTLDSKTGIISGTPTAITQAAAYVVTGTNSGGSTSTTLDLSIGDTASGSIGTSGGTITTPGGASLQIPFGGVDSSTTITISVTTLAPPAGIGAIGPVYEIDPQSTLFATPVQISLPVPPGTASGAIYANTGGGYVSIGGTIVGGSIVSQTPQLGLFVVGAAQATRTVEGVGQITWLSATARISEPIDFGAQGVEALIPNGQGGLTHLPGAAGATLGTFTIANVPIGQYILHSGQQYLVTATNTPDLGSVRGGRPVAQRIPITQPTLLNLSIAGMTPWDPSGWFEFYSTEADDWDFSTDRFQEPTPGVQSTFLPIDLSQLDGTSFGPSAIQGSLGDHVILAQLATQVSANGFPYLAMTRAAQITPVFDLLDGQTVSASVTLADVSQGNTISVDYRGTQFVTALNQDGNPGHLTVCPVCGGFAGVLAQAGDAQDGFYDANGDPLLLNDYAPAGTDILSGAMTYGSPSDSTLAGNWGLIFDVRWMARTYLAELPGTYGLGPGMWNGVPDAIEWVTTPDSGQSGALVPPVSLPSNITVNGEAFFDGGGDLGLTPIIAWSAPRIGHADFYTLGVRHLFADGNNLTEAVQITNIATSGNSITLPPGIIQSGEPYVFVLTAVESTSPASAQLLNAPFKSSIDVATGTTSSGIFWAGAVPAPNNYAQVSTIQDGLQYPIGLTATAGALYWTERGDSPWNCTSDTHQGRIWTSGLDGSNPHPIAAGQPDPMGIAVTPEAVYWTNDDVTYDSNCNGMGNGSVVRFDLNTSDITTVATNQNQPGTALLAVDGSIFWSGQGMQALYAGASSPTLLGWFGGVNLASDGSNLYWADYGNYPNAPGGQVWQLPLTGGTPLSLASGQAQTWDVQTDGANVYFSDQAWQQPFPASINSVPVGGGPVTNLATGNEIMKVFGIDSSSAYYVSNGLLYTVPLNGSAAPKVLAPLELGGCPEGNLVVSGHNVYWTDTCSQSVQHASW